MARDFDGADDKVTIANESVFDIDFDEPFSIGGFISLDTSGANISKGTGTPRILFYNRVGINPSIFIASTGGTIERSTNQNVADSTYRSTFATYNGGTAATDAKIFFDGVETAYDISSGSVATSLLNDVAVVLGNDAADAWDLNGREFYMAFYNIELGANDLLALAHGVPPLIVRNEGLLGFWPLWGNQSPEPDYKGGADTGTVTGATRSTPNPAAEHIENYL